MDSRFFQISTVVIDRQDLNIYEKMCAAVLSRYAGRDEFDNLITLNVIANKMGTTEENAAKAIKSLIGKGLLDEDDIQIKRAEFEQFAKKPKKTVAKAPRKAPVKENLEEQNPTPKDDKPPVAVVPTIPKTVNDQDRLIQAVYEIIDENINEREARIILNFAGNDIDIIKEKYKVAKKSQIADKIELLMMELQKKPKSTNQTAVKNQVKSEKEPQTKVKNEETHVAYGQLNLNKINKMKAYKEVSNMMKKKD